MAGANPAPRRAALLQQAAKAIERGHHAEAQRALGAVLALAPEDADALRLLGISYHQQARYAPALASLRAAHRQRPQDPLILNNLGSCLRASGDVEAALAAFRQAVALAPQLAAAWFNLGKTLKAAAHPEAALAALQQALACAPGHLGAQVVLGDTQKQLGRIDAAAASYRAALRLRPQAGLAWYALANLKTVRFDAAETAALERALAQPGMSADERIAAGFAQAKALDDAGDFRAAFACLGAANAAKRRQTPWDARAFSASVAASVDAFAGPVAPAPDPALGREVIFVVSLPRSGSTLTEQILAAHPEVEGAGELSDLPAVIAEESARRGAAFPHWVGAATPADWARLGRRYLERTARWREQRPRFTDKGLRNWPLLGAALAMLPGARVIDCRRDPLETGLSCYRQLFARGQEFSYDLADIGAYWRDYDRALRHWQAQYPARLFEQVYERLLDRPEAQTRHLLEFCGLAFDPACLRSHEAERSVRTASAAQVRQPLRRDTARVPDYTDWLEPLRRALVG